MTRICHLQRSPEGRERDPRRDAPLATRRVYEVRLAHFLTRSSWAVRSAQRMIATARRYIEARAALSVARGPRRRIEVIQLLQRCGRPWDDPYAGRVGLGALRLSGVFSGRGNLRELMAHVWSFARNLLCHDLVGEHRHPRWPEIAASAGFDVAAIEVMIRRARAYREGRTRQGALGIDELDAKKDFLDMPWHPLRRRQAAMRVASPGQKARWSTVTREEFAAMGGRLSAVENELSSGLGDELVPWIDAGKVWSLNESSSFVQEARRAGIPLVSGISGVTMQLLQIARLLNIGPPENVRLACLGYLMSTGAHSFHEVMAAAEPFGCAYDAPGNYLNIPPLLGSEIVSVCGAAPLDRPAPCSSGDDCALPKWWPSRARRRGRRSPPSSGARPAWRHTRRRVG